MRDAKMFEISIGSPAKAALRMLVSPVDKRTDGMGDSGGHPDAKHYLVTISPQNEPSNDMFWFTTVIGSNYPIPDTALREMLNRTLVSWARSYDEYLYHYGGINTPRWENMYKTEMWRKERLAAMGFDHDKIAYLTSCLYTGAYLMDEVKSTDETQEMPKLVLAPRGKRLF